MKMFLIVYSREADEAILAAFKRSGITAYTKMQEVRGEGRDTEPKLGNHIWPGMNNILFLVMEDEQVAQTKEVINQLKQEHPRSGIKGFVLPLEDCI